MMNVLGWGVATILVIVTIGIHYETIRLASDLVLPWSIKRFHDRRVIMMTIMTLMLGHIAEIWIFAAAMMDITSHASWGSLTGNDFDKSFNSFIYFSASSYTSASFGDLSPHGLLRPVAVSEALTGLIMIAWSASFTYLKMEQIWNRRRKNN